MTIFQITALAYLIIYCGILIGLRGFLLYKRTGINPIKSRKKTGIEGYVENVLKFCFILIVVVILNFVFIENNYSLLIPITYLETSLIAYTGMALSMIGLVFGFVSQLQMGDSWRLGLNENETTQLIDHGIYKFSRNPIYLGYLISNIGFFMLMPNAISLSILALSYVSIAIKIRLEENHLIKKNGLEYERYLKRVRRWF